MSEFNSHDPESVAKALDRSREEAEISIQAQIAGVRQRWPENFRKSLAYYVGSRVEWTGEEAWRKEVFDIVDLVLLGIEHSDSHKLVTK